MSALESSIRPNITSMSSIAFEMFSVPSGGRRVYWLQQLQVVAHARNLRFHSPR